MHSGTTDYQLGLCSGKSTSYTSQPPVSESLVPLLPKVDLQLVKQDNQDPPIVPYNHQPDLAGITGNAPRTELKPKRRSHVRKRKSTSLSDTPWEGVGSPASQDLNPRPLTKRPKHVPEQPIHIGFDPSSSGAANLLGFSVEPGTYRASLIQPTIAPLKTKPSLGESSESSGCLPTANVLPGLIPIHGDTRAPNGAASGEEGLFDWNYLAPYAGVLSSVNHVFQDPYFGHGHHNIPVRNTSFQGLAMSEQLPGQQWTGGTGSPSMACPWNSHLEIIVSLGVAISQISRKLKSATIQPPCEVDVETLLEQLEYLQHSYLKLKKFVCV